MVGFLVLVFGFWIFEFVLEIFCFFVVFYGGFGVFVVGVCFMFGLMCGGDFLDDVI